MGSVVLVLVEYPVTGVKGCARQKQEERKKCLLDKPESLHIARVYLVLVSLSSVATTYSPSWRVALAVPE